ncbi:Ig-like domain-containing protein [Candidatus Palauibacter sp.]|uniref:Ig-like domain-containing protein n=1 Tax=Candidatus Palauibacter sp. TaxID=3101350 RepID=UPI003B5A7FD2
MTRSHGTIAWMALAILAVAMACIDGTTAPDPPPPNRAPVALDTIPALEVAAGESQEVDLSNYFEDPDGDGLTFAAETSDAGVASASTAGERLTVVAVARGTADLTVTASDPAGLSVRQTLAVTVPNGAPEPVDRIPPPPPPPSK